MARVLLILFRWGIFLLACAFLWKHLGPDKGTQALEAGTALLGEARFLPVLALVFGLMLVNWWLESSKWRWLVGHLEKVSSGRAFLATIAGTSVALVSPNRTGEFLGRILFLEPGHRVKGAFATALGSIAQFVVTLFVGAAALLAFAVYHRPMPWPEGWISVMVISLSSLLAVLTMALYLQPGLFRQLLLAVPFLKRFGRASEVLNGFERHELLTVLVLSFLRYVVFTTQFVVLLYAMGHGVPFMDSFLAVPVIYLISTLVPTIMLTELGVRGTVSLAIFAPLGGAEIPVLLATTLVWVINLVFPALAGSVILLAARIRTEG